jgi:hypothetical protein
MTSCCHHLFRHTPSADHLLYMLACARDPYRYASRWCACRLLFAFSWPILFSAWMIALLSNHVPTTTSLFEPITSYMYEHVHDQPGSHPLLPLIILQANNFPMYARTSISIYAFLLTLSLLQTYACDPCQQVGDRSSSLLSSRLPRACSFRSFSWLILFFL